MSRLCHMIFLIWVLLTVKCFMGLGSASASWCQDHHFFPHPSRHFQQKTDRFWEFNEQTKSWVEVQLPYDLISCVNDNCTVVSSIGSKTSELEEDPVVSQSEDVPRFNESLKNKVDHGCDKEEALPLRKRVSLTKMNDASIWITGQSGSIYERFWNGVQWVIAPHDLPISGAHAISIFLFNHTIFALSEAGILYQMQLSESSQPIWVEFAHTLSQNTDKEGEQSSIILIKSGVVSYDQKRVYFCTKSGSLLELREIEPPRWVNHGQPPGADVAAIANGASIREDVIYTISSAGDLYEYDRRSKPSWKKHIWREESAQDASIMPVTGSTLHGLNGDHSISLFLLTKGGKLVERRLHQRKWKWVVFGSPRDQYLTSITPVLHDDSNEKRFSLFFTTSTGSVFEYQIPKQSGIAQENKSPEAWVSHMHPLHAKVSRGLAAVQIQHGRILFPLDDARLAELHLPGLGGELSGPSHQVMFRKKATIKYVWSILDAPETEGWNAEYCTEQRGPTNCITGIKDEQNDLEIARTVTRKRKGSRSQQQHYLIPGPSGTGLAKSLEEHNLPDNWINSNYHLRAMHGGRSFFLITDGGFTFEYLYTENVWIWLRHEHSTAIKGAVGNYNGSLYAVDTNGGLFLRERNDSELAWINCSSSRKGRQVVGGPPWDAIIPGRSMTADDALFFVSRIGRLLQFTVALRKFKWKDCRNPRNTKIGSIVDQELFRENIVFVIGRNGRLYQYNKVTELWHEHFQSRHLILSRLPGTAMRPSLLSLTGSLFMLSVDGGLVEYHWNPMDGWSWVEHGTPHKVVTLVGSPGPSLEGNQLFLIGSNGNVYLRYMDQMTWKWKNCGFPKMGNSIAEDGRQRERNNKEQKFCTNEDLAATSRKDSGNVNHLSNDCNPEVAPIRPILFAQDLVIFELKDGRLAEIRRIEGANWQWSRIIGTPTSLCTESYWTALAS